MRGFFIFLLVLLVVGVVLAFYFHWVDVSVDNTNDGSQTNLKVSVNKERIKEDVSRVRKAAANIGTKAKEEVTEVAQKIEDKNKDRKIVEETVRGTLEAVKPDEVTVKAGDKTVTARVTAETKVTVGGQPAQLSDLQVGQQVNCTHVERDGTHVCVALAADKKS